MALTIPSGLLKNEAEIARLEQVLWEQGRLRHILLPDAQTRIYNFIRHWKAAHPNSAKPIVVNCHRGAGKTYLLAAMGIGRALSAPGQVIRLGAESIKETKKIVIPNIEKILEQCPRHLRPEPREGREEYWFRNPTWPRGSRPGVLHIIGLQERANRHRGERSHMVLFDECRNIPAFEYVAVTVFGPHFARQEYPVSVFCSTPPDSMDHPWSRIFCPEAEQDGRYLEIPCTSNTDWTPADDERQLELFRTKDSPEWDREMLCKRISDPARRIVREFDEKRHVVESYQRPAHFIPLAGADGGYVDFFAGLYGYIDWKAEKLVIEDSVVTKGENTGLIAERLRAKELAIFGERAEREHHIRRHADMTPREIADLNEIYKLSFSPAETHDPDSQINHLRDRFHHDQVVIVGGGGKNVELIAQLKNGVRDEKGKIPRSEVYGHYDALMALVYLNRQAPWRTNPYPQKVVIDNEHQALGRDLREQTRQEGRKPTTRVGLRGALRPRRLR